MVPPGEQEPQRERWFRTVTCFTAAPVSAASSQARAGSSIRAPEAVRDYIIYHELAHLWEMNHSDRFWARVERVCPGWREAEHWLKRSGSLLGL